MGKPPEEQALYDEIRSRFHAIPFVKEGEGRFTPAFSARLEEIRLLTVKLQRLIDLRHQKEGSE